MFLQEKNCRLAKSQNRPVLDAQSGILEQGNPDDFLRAVCLFPVIEAAIDFLCLLVGQDAIAEGDAQLWGYGNQFPMKLLARSKP